MFGTIRRARARARARRGRGGRGGRLTDYHVVHFAWHAAAAHFARMLMMVALLPRDLIGGLGEDLDAVSYSVSTHASASVIQTACAQLYRLVSILTTSLDDFSLLGARFGRPHGSGRWR